MKAHPYIFFDSNCREAFAFYEKLGIGKIGDMLANKDAPSGQDGAVSASTRGCSGATTM